MVFNMKPILVLKGRDRERETFNITNTQYKACVQNYVMLCYIIKCDVNLKNKEVNNAILEYSYAH